MVLCVGNNYVQQCRLRQLVSSSVLFSTIVGRHKIEIKVFLKNHVPNSAV